MNVPVDKFEWLIRDSGQAWMLDFWGDAAHAVQTLRETLRRTYDAYEHRFKDAPVRTHFNDDVLFQEQQSNPHKVKAFLQAMGATSSPDMLVMVWRILQGDIIRATQMRYEYERLFELSVELEDSLTEFGSRYSSTDINDAALLRHWGIIKMDNQPIFDGFDALSE